MGGDHVSDVFNDFILYDRIYGTYSVQVNFYYLQCQHGKSIKWP